MIQVLVGDETGRCKNVRIRRSSSDNDSSFDVSCINQVSESNRNRSFFSFSSFRKERRKPSFVFLFFSSAVQGLVNLFSNFQVPGRMVASVRADSSADLLHFDGNEPYFHTAMAEGGMIMSAFCPLLLIPYTLHIYLLVDGTVCAAVNKSVSPTLNVNMNMNMNTFTAPKLILACLSESVCLCVGQSL